MNIDEFLSDQYDYMDEALLRSQTQQDMWNDTFGSNRNPENGSVSTGIKLDLAAANQFDTKAFVVGPSGIIIPEGILSKLIQVFRNEIFTTYNENQLQEIKQTLLKIVNGLQGNHELPADVTQVLKDKLPAFYKLYSEYKQLITERPKLAEEYTFGFQTELRKLISKL